MGIKNFSFVTFNMHDSSWFGVNADKFMEYAIFECVGFKKETFLGENGLRFEVLEFEQAVVQENE